MPTKNKDTGKKRRLTKDSIRIKMVGQRNISRGRSRERSRGRSRKGPVVDQGERCRGRSKRRFVVDQGKIW